MQRHPTRTIWLLAEAVHAVVYFAPEKAQLYRDAGLKGGWMAYFASRSAAMGAVGAEVVSATFYNFNPDMVARALPDAWRFCQPQRVLEARHSAAQAALRRLVPDSQMSSAAYVTEILARTLDRVDFAGRPLAAAHSGIARSDDPLLALWQVCTLWREYRGDAHVAALVCNGLGPVESHLTLAATGSTDEETLRGNRGWSVEQWEQGRLRLREAGLLDASGSLTAAGARIRRRVEDITDARSDLTWEPSGHDLDVVGPLAEIVGHIVSGGGVPFPNPMGLSELELHHALGSPEPAK